MLTGGGAWVVQVSFQLLPTDTADLVRMESIMSGTECRALDPASCPSPDVNRTKLLLRSRLFADFEVLELYKQKAVGADTNECPNRWLAQASGV